MSTDVHADACVDAHDTHDIHREYDTVWHKHTHKHTRKYDHGYDYDYDDDYDNDRDDHNEDDQPMFMESAPIPHVDERARIINPLDPAKTDDKKSKTCPYAS